MELHFCASGGSGGIPYSISQNGSVFMQSDNSLISLVFIGIYI